MKPNIKNIKKLVNEKFNGNKSAFAKEIGVDRTQISKLFNNGSGVGAQFFGGLMELCDKENLNFREYIFLPKNVKKINKNNRYNKAS